MELQEVTPNGVGGGNEKYVVGPEEIVAARIGFTAINQREQISGLPVGGILEGDDIGHVSRDAAEHVVAGNVALISQFNSTEAAKTVLGQGPQLTIEGGLEALSEGRRQLMAILNG